MNMRRIGAARVDGNMHATVGVLLIEEGKESRKGWTMMVEPSGQPERFETQRVVHEVPVELSEDDVRNLNGFWPRLTDGGFDGGKTPETRLIEAVFKAGLEIGKVLAGIQCKECGLGQFAHLDDGRSPAPKCTTFVRRT